MRQSGHNPVNSLRSFVFAYRYSRQSSRLQDVGGDADGDAFGALPDRVADEVRIARDRLPPAVTEQPADDR